MRRRSQGSQMRKCPDVVGISGTGNTARVMGHSYIGCEFGVRHDEDVEVWTQQPMEMLRRGFAQFWSSGGRLGQSN